MLLRYFCPELMIQREYVTERMGVWELKWDVADVDKLEIKFLVLGTIKIHAIYHIRPFQHLKKRVEPA